MKVLHIIDSFGFGGTQTLLKNIFETQNKNKNIFLFVLRKRQITIKVNHKQVIIFESKKKYSFVPLKILKRIIKKENITILHCHLLRSFLFGFLLKILYFPNIKLIFHEHGKIFKNNVVYNKFLNLSKNKVDLFIAVSKATKKKLIEKAKINEKKIQVLYNFVNLEKFNRKNITWDIQKEREKVGIKKDEFVIGFVGRLSKVKGCEQLIRALPLLNFKYKCLIIGDGPLRKNLEKLVKKLKLEDKVVFLGYQREVQRFYLLLDLLVVPSLFESFGLSVIESQAMGIPTIGSNVEALNEIIQQEYNGLLFQSKNVIELTQKIDLIYNNPGLKKRIIKNSLKELKKYSLKEYILELNKLYKKI